VPYWSRAVSAWVRQLPLFASNMAAKGRRSKADSTWKRVPTREADRLHLHVEKVRSAAEVYRTLPRYSSPRDFAAALQHLLDAHDQNVG